MATEEADVLVLGGGPVGLDMAAELSYRGVSTLLLEKNPTTSKSPKAVSLSSRTMEHFRRIGLEEKIQDASYPPDLPVTFSFTSGAYKGHTIFSRSFSSWGELKNNPDKNLEFPFYQSKASLGFPMLCPQLTSEAVIRKHIEDTSKCVQMFWGWGATSLSQDDSGVTVKAMNEAGEEKTFKARYLVGCDGGSSFTRKALGLHTYGKFVVARACTIWFSCPQFFEHMRKTGTSGFNIVVNNEINCLTISLNAKGDFALHAFLPAAATDEEIQRLVQNPKWCIETAMGSSELPVEVYSVSGYSMHALVSTKFREGRCFLAGDSAHQWLPAGGLGLNTGISDVADLAWKLEAVVKGYGGDKLLDSYEIERRPLDDSTRRFALSLGGTLSLGVPRYQLIIRDILLSNRVTAYILGKVMNSALSGQFLSGIDLVLGFQYSNSNVIMHQYNQDGKIRLHCNADSKFIPASLPGCRAPHVALPECETIIDLFGKDFVLLVIGGAESDLKELKEVMEEGKVPFSSYAYPPLPELTALYDRKYFLIRPDGVVAWRADYQPSTAESKKIVAIVLGHMTGDSPRLPPPIMTYTPPTSPAYRGFIRDTLIRLSVAGIVLYTTKSYSRAYWAGLGVFLFFRSLSVTPPPCKTEKTSRHKAAVISKYGSAGSVLKILPKHVGTFGMDDVLVQVRASSVSQFDLFMIKGHGRSTYQRQARLCGGSYFPLILGRECSGEVVAVGDNVSDFLPGDMVYAAVPPHRQGCHAQLVAVDRRHVAFKPSNVDHKEATSLPWAATMAWTALVTHAGLNSASTRGKKVLVLRGTSEVGVVAIQMLKAWGAYVATTCPTEDTTFAHHLGADKVVDDQTGDFASVLSSYDVVLDTVGGKTERPSLSTLKYYSNSVYVSCASPREKLVDSLGGFLGELVFSTLYRYKVISNRVFGGRGFYYSGTEVGGDALREVRGLVESGAVRPVIDSVYGLEEIVDAHKHVEAGQTRGKVVLSIS